MSLATLYPAPQGAAPTGTRTHTELWCVHLVGPDDMQPAPSKEEAEAMAVLLNGALSRRVNIGDQPPMKAVAREWPYTADAWMMHVEGFYRILAS